MNEMVERVARAIMHMHDTGEKNHFASYARAAISAMREPTADMIYAGARGSGEDSDGVALGAWHAMIDAALETSSGNPRS